MRDDDFVWEPELFNGRVVEYGLPMVASSSGGGCRLLSFLLRNSAAVDWKLSPRVVCLGEAVGEVGGQFGVWLFLTKARGAVPAIGLVCALRGESLSGEGGDVPVAAPKSLRTPFIRVS